MSTNKVCDVCQDATKQPVFVVRVGIEVLGAVAGSQSTGCSHEIEACEGCWTTAMADVSSNVLHQITRDIPVHRAVAVVNDEISVLHGDLRAAVLKRDELVPTSVSYKAAVAAVDQILISLDAKELERLNLLKTYA